MSLDENDSKGLMFNLVRRRAVRRTLTRVRHLHFGRSLGFIPYHFISQKYGFGLSATRLHTGGTSGALYSPRLNIRPAVRKPPSTFNVCPQTCLASSEARNTAASAISSGVP